MAVLRFLLNDAVIETDMPPGTVALDFIRERQNLRGTKEGCREGECGACTVLVGRMESRDDTTTAKLIYRAEASCLIPLAELAGTHVVTVDGLGPDLTPVQTALHDRFAAQCGFCTPGFVMSLTGLFATTLSLTQDHALDAMDGNICRCTGYVPIRDAARDLLRDHGDLDSSRDRIPQLVERGILPEFCLSASERLATLDQAAIGAADSGPLMAGGTDLYIQDSDSLLDAPEIRLVGQTAVETGISVRNDKLYIGGAVTVEQLRVSSMVAALLPTLHEDLGLVASTILRNRATLAGNIVNASPIADLAIILLALGASLEIGTETPDGVDARVIPLKDFYRGYKDIDLREDELIIAITVPGSARGHRFNFEKVSKRRVLDIASVNTAISLLVEGEVIREASVSAGGVAPTPLYLAGCSRFLRGASITADSAVQAAAVALEEVSPISDVRGSADYKRLLLRQLIYAHFLELFPDRIEPEALL